MQRIITKFGGTSVSSIKNWKNILQITRNNIKANKQPIIVCSAFSQVSNKLEAAIQAALVNEHHAIFDEVKQTYLNLAKDMKVNGEKLLSADLNHLQQLLTGIALIKEASPRTKAQILASGEMMMTHLGCAFLKKHRIKCVWYDARDALKTKRYNQDSTSRYLSARCDHGKDEALIKQFNQCDAQAVITQGFVAANEHDETVLLGRGGSDTSASLLASKLAAVACEIWTDVPGIYTANPYQLPQARLLKQLNYDEAQECATMGAKVLHPGCIPPVKTANIPLFVKYTKLPQHCGTKISHLSDELAPPIKSIQTKQNVILVSINTVSMWQQVGFLADIFNCFKQQGFSVDMISTSEFNVTVSLDPNERLKERGALDELLEALNTISHAKLIEPCSVISLVGQNIRTILNQLGPSLEVFEAQQVHMMSLASNDLNLSFVVDESQADKLTQKLHALLIENNPRSFYYSKTWQEEFGQSQQRDKPWWERKAKRLLSHGKKHSPCYVYDKQTLDEKALALKGLENIDRVFFAIKANPNSEILKCFNKHNLGFECVSTGEIEHVLSLFPKISRERILFTPNFASRSEYQQAFKLGCFVTVDSLYPLQRWPSLFKNRQILLRIDPGSGAGHHKYVVTGGSESKFGIPQQDIPEVIELCKKHHIDVCGLHAHFGSGILKPDIWPQTANLLTHISSEFNNIRFINLGGGLGIVERPGQQPLDLNALDETLAPVKQTNPNLEFWLEPGRFLAAQSGVILARVTQTKVKGDVNFIGIETGMNSLIRPALYGAYHEIVNLSKLNQENTHMAHIVGPICESGDTLGYSRMMPETNEGDIILIANTGAYGHCMSSQYNLRLPASETMID